MAKKKIKERYTKTFQFKGTVAEAEAHIEASIIQTAADHPTEQTIVYRPLTDADQGPAVSHFHNGMSRFMVGYFAKVEFCQDKDSFSLKGKVIDILAALYLLQLAAKGSKEKEEQRYVEPIENILLGMMSFDDDQMEQAAMLEAVQADPDFMEIRFSLENENAQP